MRKSAILALLFLASALLPAPSAGQEPLDLLPPGDYPPMANIAVNPIPFFCTSTTGPTFHVGDLIAIVTCARLELTIGIGAPGLCPPFNYSQPGQCAGYIVINGDIGNYGNVSGIVTAPGSITSPCAGLNAYFFGPEFLTSYDTPGTYTLTATAYACQSSPGVNPQTLQYDYTPTTTAFATTTITLTILPPQVSGADLGPCSDCEAAGGSPINLMTGNVWIQQHDYSLPGLGGGLQLSRTWNSQLQDGAPVSLSGMFGTGWRSTYEEQLTFPNSSTITYARSDGSAWTLHTWQRRPDLFRYLAP